MDLTLSEVPFLEEVTAILLMRGMDLRKVHHLLLEFHLGETLLHEEIILLVHGSVAALAGSGEDLEAASQTISQKEGVNKFDSNIQSAMLHQFQLNHFMSSRLNLS